MDTSLPPKVTHSPGLSRLLDEGSGRWMGVGRISWFTGGYLGEASEWDASEGGRSLRRSRGTHGTILRPIGQGRDHRAQNFNCDYLGDASERDFMKKKLSLTRSRSTGGAILKGIGEHFCPRTYPELIAPRRAGHGAGWRGVFLVCDITHEVEVHRRCEFEGHWGTFLITHLLTYPTII